MRDLYQPLIDIGSQIIFMSNISAEMTKYAANSFLAVKISFINEMANLCDASQADIDEVREGIITDHRIGKEFFSPGPGFGGSCFPKDIRELLSRSKELGAGLKIVEAAESVNKAQKLRIFDKVKKHYKNNLSGKVFSLWGVAFKANTDDVRESPAIDLTEALIKEGASVHVYDPAAVEIILSALVITTQFVHLVVCMIV